MTTPDKKPDFSNVQSSSDTAPASGGGGGGGGGGRPDFSNVVSGSDTVAASGKGGGGGAQTYTIEKGDTLSQISKRFYGKAKYWRKIFEANTDVIKDPDKIYPGQTIKLPAIDVDGDGDLDDPSDN